MEKMRQFSELRSEWEKGLEVLTEIHRPSELLVVLQNPERCHEGNGFHCLRYFKIGNKWRVSADAQSVPLRDVWQWLANPSAGYSNTPPM
jgi:hypothetical protein